MRKFAQLSREARLRKMKNADNHRNRRYWHKMFLAQGFRVGIETLEKSGRIRRVYWRDTILSKAVEVRS